MPRSISEAAKLLADNPCLTTARAALTLLGLRFPFSIEIDAHQAAEFPNGAAVLKVSQPFIAHKTEVGAVKVVSDLSDRVLADFVENVEKRLGKPVERVTVEERVTIPEGGEALLSVLYDDSFGPVMVFGEGGQLTELRKNVVRWLPGESAEHIAEVINSLPLAKYWFREYRGMPSLVDGTKWCQFLANLGEFIKQFHELRPDLIIRDLEINPVAFTRRDPVALDLLVTIEPKPQVQQSERPDLERLAKSLFQAKAVAVAGVSASDPTNLGRVLYDRLLHSFKGQAWAINPKGGEVAGRPIYKQVSDLPFAPDVLVLALSARFTAPTLEQAYNKFGSDLGAVLMLASGFDETSGGQQSAVELKEVVRKVGGTPVLGPNTMALYSVTGSDGDVQVDFLPEGRVAIPSFSDPTRNNTALILQSGARFSSFLDKQPCLGFRWSIMVGNAYQTDAADGLALAAADPNTKVAAVYLEGLHPGAGVRLAKAIKACKAQGKAVIIQKGGRTAKGAATARSHTASMSGSHDVFEAIVTQAGALVVESETDFVDVVCLASVLADKKPQGPNLFIINGAGYEGVLASDEAAGHGLELPKPPAGVTEVLQPYLGKILDSTNNPADVGPATPDQAYAPALRAALNSEVYDCAVVAVMPHGNGMFGVLPPYDKPELLGPQLIDFCREQQKPVIISVNGGAKYAPFREYLQKYGIPVFPDSQRAVRALGLWYKLVK